MSKEDLSYRQPKAGTGIVAAVVAFACSIIMIFAGNVWYYSAAAVALTVLNILRFAFFQAPFIGSRIVVIAFFIFGICFIVAAIAVLLCTCNIMLYIYSISGLINILLNIFVGVLCRNAFAKEEEE